MTDYVATPDLRVALVIARLCHYMQKNYAYPSYAKLKHLVLMFTGRTISTRSLARHIGALVRDGWLTRQRRHTTALDGTLELHSTLYVCTARTRRWLADLGAKWWISTVNARNSLFSLALPDMADTPRERLSSTPNRAARAPPQA